MPIEERRPFLGLDFDMRDADATVAWLRAVRADTPFAYVVTPNVDHLVRLDRVDERGEGGALWDAYRRATLILCDSRIVARLAAWRGVALPVVPGSDLTVRLFDEVLAPGDRVAIIGGDTALRADLARRYPDIELVQHIPPMGLMRDPAAMAAAVAFGRDAGARFLLVAVGSPQQEVIAGRIAQGGGAGGCALCIGASLDFIVGRQRRAPRVLQRLGLEWSHRLLSHPGRLWRRYLIEGPRIFRMAARWRAPQ
jgi:exopolysaccharide biosynthesis WecB/TagA/CpsF family protein